MSTTSPDHYKNHPTGLECIDLVRYMPCPIANLIKYLWRWEKKDGAQDLEKALVYLGWIDPTTVQQLRDLPELTPTRANIISARKGLERHYDPSMELRKKTMNMGPAPAGIKKDPLFFVLLWLSQDPDNWEHLYTARGLITQKIHELKGDQA